MRSTDPPGAGREAERIAGASERGDVAERGGVAARGAEPRGEVTSRAVAGALLGPAAIAGLPLVLAGPAGLAAAAVLDVALVAGAAIEGRRMAGRAPEVERVPAGRWVLGAKNAVTIRIRNTGAARLRLRVRDDLPDGWTAEPAELVLELPPWASRDVVYTVVPPRRGRAALGDLHVRVEGPLGLGSAIVTVPAADEVRVYPDVLGGRQSLAARLRQLRREGSRSVRAAGAGGELDRLREYVAGDAFRDLEWKSSARRARPITRVMQDERSQNVVVAVDAGRTMAGRLGARSKLDHAIQAALLLAHVALRQGDRVGLVVFSSEVRLFVPPGRGPGQYRRLLEALFPVEADGRYVDFRALVELARARLRRRALLVVLSDLLDAAAHGDEPSAVPFVAHAPLLRKKHLPVCVTMRDPASEALAAAPVSDTAAAYVRAAAADLLAERAAVKAHLRKAGVHVLEAPAGDLAVATVHHYLELKSRRAL